MKKVAITTTSFGKYDEKPLNVLKEYGLEIFLNPYGRKLVKEEVVETCENALGIIAGTETIDVDILGKLPDLKVISRCGGGLDNVDVDTAHRLGIKVFNTPDAPTVAVAELTVGLILNLLRKVNQMDFAIRTGKWNKLMGNLLSGKKVGIIGFGRIGKKVAKLLKTFDCEVNYYDIKTENEVSGCERMDMDELLKISDIISIHVSSNDRIIGEKEINLMKKNAFLVNTSRGGVVDERILYKALKDKCMLGAALDVFWQEPYSGQLKELDNIILTPHIGSYAKESRVEMEMQAVENLLKGLSAEDFKRDG